MRPALPATVVRSAPFFDGDVVFVRELVGFKSVLVSVPVLVTPGVMLSTEREKKKGSDLSDRHREE